MKAQKETYIILKQVYGDFQLVSGRFVRNSQLISSISAETELVRNYLVKEVIQINAIFVGKEEFI